MSDSAENRARQKTLKDFRQSVKANRQELKKSERRLELAERKAARPASGTGSAPRRPISEGKPVPKGMVIAPRGSSNKEPAKTPRDKVAMAEKLLRSKAGRASGKPAPTARGSRFN